MVPPTVREEESRSQGPDRPGSVGRNEARHGRGQSRDRQDPEGTRDPPRTGPPSERDDGVGGIESEQGEAGRRTDDRVGIGGWAHGLTSGPEAVLFDKKGPRNIG